MEKKELEKEIERHENCLKEKNKRITDLEISFLKARFLYRKIVSTFIFFGSIVLLVFIFYIGSSYLDANKEPFIIEISSLNSHSILYALIIVGVIFIGVLFLLLVDWMYDLEIDIEEKEKLKVELEKVG